MQEGFLDFNGYKTYYRSYGDSSLTKTPLVVLHGGPGSTHHYVENLHAITKTGRKVIFYDQFGSGQSEGRDEKRLWKIETFIDQLDVVRRELGLNDIHLLGHSWGGMLAIEYLLTNPYGVSSAVLSSAMIDMHLYQEEVDKLLDDLPEETRRVIKRHHEAGSIEDEEYKTAFQSYDDKHIFRGEKWPQEIKTPAGAFNADLYHTMWGLSEAYTTTGTMRDWSRLNDLKKIQTPVLITSGDYDELTPRQARITQESIPGSELRIFKDASHCHHVEKEHEYLAVVSKFLDIHDQSLIR